MNPFARLAVSCINEIFHAIGIHAFALSLEHLLHLTLPVALGAAVIAWSFGCAVGAHTLGMEESTPTDVLCAACRRIRCFTKSEFIALNLSDQRTKS